jgi:hypothetical protein
MNWIERYVAETIKLCSERFMYVSSAAYPNLKILLETITLKVTPL